MSAPTQPPRHAALIQLSGRGLSAGIDLVFPPICADCGVSIDTSDNGLLCQSCRSALTADGTACQRCGAPNPPDAMAGRCPHCGGHQFHFDGVVRLATYEDALRTAVLRIKQPRDRGLAMALGDLLATTRGEQLRAWQPEAVVPIPMHWSRRWWRGTNSPATIAERLAAQLGIPLAPHLLERRRRTAPQASLSRPKRLANVRGAFRAAKHRDLPGSRLLVVDDIMTTGATVDEAAKVLSRSGAGFIGVAVLARAMGEN